MINLAQIIENYNKNAIKIRTNITFIIIKKSNGIYNFVSVLFIFFHHNAQTLYWPFYNWEWPFASLELHCEIPAPSS